MALDQRLAGVLLHPTSLPGRYGIGDLGPECVRFLDWMTEAGLGYWQTLPLGPTSFGDSPYQCFSAFAGNPLLVSPEVLVRDGIIEASDIKTPPFRDDFVDYGPVIEWKTAFLRMVWEKFKGFSKSSIEQKKFENFQKRKDVKTWLNDYAEFRVLKDMFDGQSWDNWDAKYRTRDAAALKKLAKDEADNIAFHKFCQFLFFDQWDRIRAMAHARNIQIIGDAPIYVAFDSSDTWANQDIFLLDKRGLPQSVAGVPPDYFSATGQLWGNPLYDWDKLKATKYKWWIERMTSIFAVVDIVRLDHFRGFMGYWAVPFGESTAINGKWIEGPGDDFFAAIKRKFKDMPIIAEDLGEISPDVYAIRDKYQLPGMKVLQFAFGCYSVEPLIPDPGQDFQPHHHIKNCVVYTGTHDNDTTVGWYQNSSAPAERHHMRVYLQTDGSMPHMDLIRAAYMSAANTAIVPMQDFLGLGSEARMNFPGKAEGNWAWRLRPEQLSWELSQYLRTLSLLFQRCSNPPAEAVPAEGGTKIVYEKL